MPLIDHNPRGGEKIIFEPPDAIRYRERTVAERLNARLKDEFGGRNVLVRGYLTPSYPNTLWHERRILAKKYPG